MKVIIFLENNPAHLRMDYSKIYDPEKYRFFVLAAPAAFKDLTETQQDKFCEQVYLVQDFNFNSLKEIAENIEKEYGRIANIVTLEELSVRFSGQLAKYFGLEPDHYDRFVDKHVMKQVLAKNMPNAIPKYSLFQRSAYLDAPGEYLDTLMQTMNFPLFTKPTDMVGSIEASKINNREELDAWAERAAKIDLQYEIDEFIEGDLIHVDSLIQSGKIIFTGAGINSAPCAEFFNGKPTGSLLLDSEDEIAKHVSQFAADIHQALGMPSNGVTHLEIFHTQDGELKFLEIAYRPAGAYIPNMYMEGYGLDIKKSHVLLQIDPNYSLQLTRSQYTAYLDYPPVVGILQKQQTNLNLKSQYRLEWSASEGTVLTSAEHIGEWLCRISLTNKNYKELQNEFSKLQYLPPYQIKEKVQDEKAQSERGTKLIAMLGLYNPKSTVPENADFYKPKSTSIENVGFYKPKSTDIENVSALVEDKKHHVTPAL